ncbi:MAG: hypothetical protein H7Z76_04955 [Methylotenera sp.]|nr:hypothetical protein [Flavobacterium sp.]
MKKHPEKIGFNLQNIRTEQFAILEENYTPEKAINLSTTVAFKINIENRQIGVFAKFEFVQVKKIFLKIELSCHFELNKPSWDSLKNDQKTKLQVPKDFLAHLLIITVGTTRGVLFAKTENTPYHQFIIPSLDIQDIANEDAIFDLIDSDTNEAD